MRERFIPLNMLLMTVRPRYSRSHFARRLETTSMTNKSFSGLSRRLGTGAATYLYPNPSLPKEREFAGCARRLVSVDIPNGVRRALDSRFRGNDGEEGGNDGEEGGNEGGEGGNDGEGRE